MTRDENDYGTMPRAQLRSELGRVTVELSAWYQSAALSKQDESNAFLVAYGASPAKSVAERRMEANLATSMQHNEVVDAEGQILRLVALRDMLVILITYENPLVMATANGLVEG